MDQDKGTKSTPWPEQSQQTDNQQVSDDSKQSGDRDEEDPKLLDILTEDADEDELEGDD